MFDSRTSDGESPDGILRILDFGLAHFEGQESLTLAGDIVGTVYYMSPEQAQAKKSKLFLAGHGGMMNRSITREETCYHVARCRNTG